MFRQEAIDHLKITWRGRAVLLPGFPFWILAILCIFFITALLTFIIAGSYHRRANVTGEVSTYPRAANVYSSTQGIVIKKFVSEGQIVKAGDPIYQIDVSKSTREGVLSDNKRQDINKQLDHILEIIKRLESNKKSTLEMLGKQKKQYMEAFLRSTDIMNRAYEGIYILKNNMNNYKDYYKRGLINKDQLIDKIALYYQQQNNQLSISNQNDQNNIQITTLESQIETRSAEFDNQVYQMELQLYELQKELLSINADGSIIVTALTDGCIDSLSVTVGQMVNFGDSLLQITPSNVAYYSLILWVPNDAIPYISIGDKVNLRYEAFPIEKFGQFGGFISVISKTPASPQEMLTYQGAPKISISASTPYYKVIVRPEKKTIKYADKYLNLENGMKVQSTLFLEKRRIYQWMFSPFYDIKQSAMGQINE